VCARVDLHLDSRTASIYWTTTIITADSPQERTPFRRVYLQASFIAFAAQSEGQLAAILKKHGEVKLSIKRRGFDHV